MSTGRAGGGGTRARGIGRDFDGNVVRTLYRKLNRAVASGGSRTVGRAGGGWHFP